MAAHLIVQLRCDAPNCKNKLTIPTRDIRLARRFAESERDWTYRSREDLCRIHARIEEVAS